MRDDTGAGGGTVRLAARHRPPGATAATLIVAALLVVVAISVLAEGGNALVAGVLAAVGAAGFVLERRTRGTGA